jgi:hypothetical protein
MQNKPFRFGPIAVANAAGNILNPGTSNAGVNDGTPNKRIILTHIRIVNKTNAAVNVSAWIGATGASAAGTEFGWSTTPVPPNTANPNFLDWYGRMPLENADFLTMLASTATSLTVEGEGEVGLV